MLYLLFNFDANLLIKVNLEWPQATKMRLRPGRVGLRAVPMAETTPKLKFNLTPDRIIHLLLLITLSIASALPLMQYWGWSKLASISATTPLVCSLNQHFISPYWVAYFRPDDFGKVGEVQCGGVAWWLGGMVARWLGEGDGRGPAARRGATHRLNQRRRPANLTLTLTTTTILTREKNGGVAEAALEGTAASGATKAIEGDAGSAGSAGGAKKKGKKRRAAR